ncbi:MAG: exodeoxyribonuclease VII large subunit [Xanthomonadales bacterium]|nr:exodeoxyribonuclease VII large subunit [Xanthomonadales bacterium]MBK7144809.1 exodeoxyribonuclease VII large subunit [Xanthomonadales bacterium]
MSDSPSPTTTTLTPTALNAAVRAALERNFPLFWIEGEVSNFLRAKSGHLYFSLKDAGAQVRCAMWRPRAMLMRFAPGDGQHVLARARVTLYEPRGEFQLQIEHLEPAGQGALQRAYEELKAKLEAEGLFASTRRRSLPAFPRRIAVVTSPSGAAIRDVLAVLGRRFPLAVVDLFPSLVQGTEAAAALRRQLEAIAQLGRHDVVLLTRGGGAIEDLAAFNDEALVRCIAAMPMAVLSAVGHETDFTIADFVADLRAATPSAAAEHLVPDRGALGERLRLLVRRLHRATEYRLERDAQALDRAHLRLSARHPLQWLKRLDERLQHAHARLLRAPAPQFAQHRQRLTLLHSRLLRAAGFERAALAKRRSEHARIRLLTALQHCLAQHAERLAGLSRSLHVLSPLATLDRGYALAFDAQGRLLTSVHAIVPSAALRLRLHDGHLDTQVLSRHPNP